MKTYSRKSSSYLKKAFVASNFNEMCRLCLSEVDMVLTPIIQDSQMSYQEWIHYSVDVLVEEGDGLPPNICEVCLGMVEQSYLFKKKCQASDSKLREHFQLMDSIESKTTGVKFECTNNSSTLSSSKDETEASQASSNPNVVDPGGPMESEETESSKSETTAKSVETGQNNESVDSKNDTNCNIQAKGNVEKEVVRPIKEENIILNEVKRYVWKNVSNGEKDVGVCEVVHYDIRKEGEDSNDEFESNGDSIVRSYSSTDLLEEYTKNLNDSDSENSPVQLHLMQNASCSDVRIEKKNGQILTSEQLEGPEKLEGRIQEICQLWDNDDEAEILEGEGAEENEDEEEEEEGECDEGMEQEGEGEEVEEGDDEEGLVVDVSWEENGNQKVDSGNGEEVIELNFDENGVIQTHKVFTTENCNHMFEAVTDKENEFRCLNCHKHVAVEEVKNYSAAANRDPSKSATCKICWKNYTTPNNLKRHMLVHSGVKPHECEICGRKFSQTSILKRHILTHGKKKPFECSFCQKSYTQKMNLLTHLRNHGIKMKTITHRCKLCHKSFVHPSGLSRHLKQHKGVRFCCTRCNKSFSDASAMSRHVKTTHSSVVDGSPLRDG